MKIIDLTGLLISNKTMPKHIIFEEEEYYWDSSANDYICNDHDATQLFYNQYNMSNLPLFLGKTVEILEEEKKIPEKIEIYEDEEGHYFIDKHCKKIYITCDEVNFMVEEFNQLIDYLKSKGE